MGLGHPKPEPRVREPKRLKRGKPPARTRMKAKRKKRPVPKYLHPVYRKWREGLFEAKGRICLLRYPVCTYEATTVQHHKYGRGRGYKRLIVPYEDADPACFACHKVEDPWLGEGFGLGSRERNEHAKLHRRNNAREG